MGKKINNEIERSSTGERKGRKNEKTQRYE
jgi:hypothetical protein